jgi:hypothetical protein
MKGERLGASTEVLERPANPQVVFISAAGGTYDGLRSVQGALSSEFGTENVTVFNSALFGEKISSDRFKQMGAIIKSKIEKGPTAIIAHSFGAAETMAAFKEIEKEDPGFFKKQETLDNLNLVLISPAGFFRNWRNGLKYVSKYAKLGVQEAGMLRRTFPGKGSILQGIVSASSVPTEAVYRDDLIQGVRNVSQKLSQVEGQVRVVDAFPDRDYMPFTDAKTQGKLQALDARIAEAASADTLTARQRRAARKALRQRGRLTRKVVNEAFKNAHAKAFGDPVIQHHKYEKDRDAKKAKRRLIIDTFVKGKVLEKMSAWQDAGMRINIVIPEHDTMMSVDEARNFLQGNSDRLAVTPLSTHSAPWAPQPRILTELVKSF